MNEQQKLNDIKSRLVQLANDIGDEVAKQKANEAIKKIEDISKRISKTTRG